MIRVSPSTFPLVPRVGLLAALVVLASCAVVLLACAVSAWMTVGAPASDGLLLAPFRWAPLSRGLA